MTHDNKTDVVRALNKEGYEVIHSLKENTYWVAEKHIRLGGTDYSVRVSNRLVYHNGNNVLVYDVVTTTVDLLREVRLRYTYQDTDNLIKTLVNGHSDTMALLSKLSDDLMVLSTHYPLTYG